MNTTSNPNEPNWAPLSPKTEAKKEDAFNLLDELQKEFAKEDALREVIGMALPPRAVSSPEDLELDALAEEFKDEINELCGVPAAQRIGKTEKKGAPFSGKLWAQHLRDSGWKEATDGVTAVELPGSGHSPAKPDSTNENPPEPLTKKEEAEMLSLVEELVRGVRKKTPDQLIGAALYTGLEGKMGFAIYPTGEISSIFSHRDTGMEGIKLVGAAFRHIKANPVEGLWAASFNTRLVVLFTRFCGFKPVARVAYDPAERSDRTASNPEYRDFEGGHPSTVIYRLDPQNAKPMDAADVLAAFPETMSFADAVALAKGLAVESHARQQRSEPSQGQHTVGETIK